MMKNILIKKLNEVLNSKNVKCINCNGLVQFIDKDSNEEFGVMGFNSFKCNCKFHRDNIDCVAYVNTKLGEKVDLAKYLKIHKILNLTEEHIEDMYEVLDFIDSELQDRNKEMVDDKFLELSMEEIIYYSEELLKTKLRKEKMPVGELNRFMAACKELDWEVFAVEHPFWDEDGDWEKVTPIAILKNLNGFSIEAYFNDYYDVLVIEVSHDTYDIFDAAAFDISTIHKLISKTSHLRDSIDFRIVRMVIAFLATNLIRRVNGIPEVVYKAPKLNMKDVMNTIRKQIVTEDIVIFGQDTSVNDWTVDHYSPKEFRFVNSRGSRLKFKVCNESENFILFGVEGNTVGNRCNLSYSECIVDKLQYTIRTDSEQSDITDNFYFIHIAHKSIEVFKYVAEKYNYKSLEDIAKTVQETLYSVLDFLSYTLTDDEIEELKTLIIPHSNFGIIKMDDNYSTLDEYIELSQMVDINRAENAIWELDSYGDYVNKYKDVLEELERDYKNRTDKLIEKFTKIKVIDMIAESYTPEEAHCIIDVNSLLR